MTSLQETAATQADDREFEIDGICHLALVCSDMRRTVDFYTNVLGLKLVKTIELPLGGGQHFFFELGRDTYLAFFWFPDAPKASPGVGNAAGLPGLGEITSAHASMNHVAFSIPVDKFEEYEQRLRDKGVETGIILNHDDSEWGVAKDQHQPGVYIRSLYFRDPDGILLEFAAWTRELREDDVSLEPVDATGATHAQER